MVLEDRLLLNLGDGSFAPEVRFDPQSKPSYAIGVPCEQVVLADMNDDQIPDVVLVGANGVTVTNSLLFGLPRVVR